MNYKSSLYLKEPEIWAFATSCWVLLHLVDREVVMDI